MILLANGFYFSINFFVRLIYLPNHYFATATSAIHMIYLCV